MKQHKAFSLLELVVIIAVIGIIISMAATAINMFLEDQTSKKQTPEKSGKTTTSTPATTSTTP